MRYPFIGAVIGTLVGFFGAPVVAILEFVSEGLFGWPNWNDSLSGRYQDVIFGNVPPWNAAMLVLSPTLACAAIGLVCGLFYWSSLATRR
jgi:hypothetical protein